MKIKKEKYGWVLYLRDLREEVKLLEIERIRKSRPELMEKIEKGYDISIGNVVSTENFREV